MKIGWFARWYRWVEYGAFARALERRRFAFLERLAGARSILVLGEGDGRALARLLAVAPEAQVDVVEVSGEMIALARRRVQDSEQDRERVRFRQEDAQAAAWPEQHYDGVVTFFFLDCFDEDVARAIIGRIAGALRAGGTWLVSDFAVPDRGWRRQHARIWLWVMYRFFGVTTGLRTRRLPPMERLLREAGMARLELEEARSGLMRSEVWVKTSI